MLASGATLASLATGNANEAVQNGLAAFGIGNNAGKGILHSAYSGFKGIKNSVTNFKDEVADEVDDGERAKKKFYEDKNRKELIKKEFADATNAERVKEYMDMLYKYHNYGATDDSISIKAMKSNDLMGNMDSNDRLLAATLANRYKGNPDGLEKEEERLKKYKGYTNDDIIRMHNAISNIDGTFA